MGRPKSWFELKEFSAAKKLAKARGHGLWKYARAIRDGKKETGYFVGNTIPAKLKNAQMEQKGL